MIPIILYYKTCAMRKMSILSNCGVDVTLFVRAINSGKEVDEKSNYEYDGWRVLHCAALVGRKDVIKHFLKHGASLDIEAKTYKEEYFKTPRTILSAKYPEILKEFEK